MNFQSHIVKTESVIKLWRMRNLTIEGKGLVFKSLAIFKIFHQSLTTTVPQAIITQLNNIQKRLYMEQKKSKNKAFNTFEQLGRCWFERC